MSKDCGVDFLSCPEWKFPLGVGDTFEVSI